MPSTEPGHDSAAMLSACIAKVAKWAGIGKSEVSGLEVDEAAENPSGKAWDFHGKYSGGSWSCGGPAGEAEPSALVVRPEAGGSQDILHGGTPLATTKPGDSAAPTPEAALSELANKSAPPSQTCLNAMSALANTSFDASDAGQNTAVALTVQNCTTAGEYIRAYKLFPGAWGMADASYIDGSNALMTIQAACLTSKSAPTCIDATAHGLL